MSWSVTAETSGAGGSRTVSVRASSPRRTATFCFEFAGHCGTAADWRRLSTGPFPVKFPVGRQRDGADYRAGGMAAASATRIELTRYHEGDNGLGGQTSIALAPASFAEAIETVAAAIAADPTATDVGTDYESCSELDGGEELHIEEPLTDDSEDERHYGRIN